AVLTVAFDHEWPSMLAMIRSLRRVGFRGPVTVQRATVAPSHRAVPDDLGPVSLGDACEVIEDRYSLALGSVAEPERWRAVVLPAALTRALEDAPAVVYVAAGVEVVAPFDGLTPAGGDQLVLIARSRTLPAPDNRYPNYADVVRAEAYAANVFAVNADSCGAC